MRKVKTDMRNAFEAAKAGPDEELNKMILNSMVRGIGESEYRKPRGRKGRNGARRRNGR